MTTERRESDMELKNSQSSQNSEHLLANFLSKGDFQSVFASNKREALPGQFPSGLEIVGDSDKADRGGETAREARTGGIEAKRPRVADKGSDEHRDAKGDHHDEKKPAVEKNASGDVTKVTYPNGDTKQFEYDAKHHVNKIIYKNGDFYEKDANTGEWSLHSKHTTDSLGQASIKVEKDGTLVMASEDGSQVMLTRPDGKIGTMERVNGQVTKIDYPGTESRKLEYDQDGLSKVTEQNGNYWKKEADGTWKQFDQKDKPTGSDLGKIEIEVTGELTLTSVNGKEEKILLPNGTVYEKENGRVTHIRRN